jgi:hypothetical protein
VVQSVPANALLKTLRSGAARMDTGGDTHKYLVVSVWEGPLDTAEAQAMPDAWLRPEEREVCPGELVRWMRAYSRRRSHGEGRG